MPAWLRGERRVLAEAVAAGLVVGAVHLLFRLSSEFLVGALNDDGVYVTLGKAIAEGAGYRSIHLVGAPVQVKYPPGFPLLLAIPWRLAGSLGAVRATVAVLNLAAAGAPAVARGRPVCRGAARAPDRVGNTARGVDRARTRVFLSRGVVLPSLAGGEWACGAACLPGEDDRRERRRVRAQAGELPFLEPGHRRLHRWPRHCRRGGGVRAPAARAHGPRAHGPRRVRPHVAVALRPGAPPAPASAVPRPAGGDHNGRGYSPLSREGEVAPAGHPRPRHAGRVLASGATPRGRRAGLADRRAATSSGSVADPHPRRA